MSGNLSEEEEIQEAQYNPLKDLVDQVQQRHRKGDLPLFVLVVVILYNFLFFTTEPGYGIYLSIPLLAVLTAYLSKYWETTNITFRRVGIAAVQVAAAVDFVVSLTFLFNPDGGYDLASLPTLILDLIALISINLWLFWKPDDE